MRNTTDKSLMARRYRGRCRGGPPSNRPRGILYNVLLEYWASQASVTGRMPGVSPEDCARSGDGSFACPGSGCDMVSEDRRGPAVVKSRCGEDPCGWYWYRLSGGGVSLGVRACSEHLHTALHEDGWSRSEGSRMDFLAWEVMTT